MFSQNFNHIQLWVQILEKTNEEVVVDYQPALVEEDLHTNTGGIFILSKVRTYKEYEIRHTLYVKILECTVKSN